MTIRYVATPNVRSGAIFWARPNSDSQISPSNSTHDQMFAINCSNKNLGMTESVFITLIEEPKKNKIQKYSSLFADFQQQQNRHQL